MIMKELSAKNVKGFLLYDPRKDRYFFRVYNQDHGFQDYELRHEDIKIEILSNDLTLLVDESGKGSLVWQPPLIECPKCGGGGFSGYGTGYDDVCDECGGRGKVIGE